MPSKSKRNQYDAIRECELDMRCIARDMSERRQAGYQMNAMRRARLRGDTIDEVELARLIARNRKLARGILVSWERLHHKMNRERARKEQVNNMFSERSNSDGVAANP